MSVPSSMTTRRAEVKYAAGLDAAVLRARRHGERRRRHRHLHLRGQRGPHQRHPDRRALFARARHLAAVGRAAAELVLRRLRSGEPRGWSTRRAAPSCAPTCCRRARRRSSCVSAVTERIQVGKDFFDVAHFEVLWQIPGPSDLGLSITAMKDGSLVRFTVPSQGLDVVRADVAASTSRTQVFSNPGDEAVDHPGRRVQPRRHAHAARQPGGRRRVCRPSSSSPAPASTIATARRTASRRSASWRAPSPRPATWRCATTSAASGRAAAAPSRPRSPIRPRTCARWSAGSNERKDVDPKRIAVVGHSEGAWVAMLAAAKERRLAAVVSLAGAGDHRAPSWSSTQQQRALEQSTLSPQDRATRVAMQKQIHAAVLTGKGWEGVPPNLRKEADTPWMQSVLLVRPGEDARGRPPADALRSRRARSPGGAVPTRNAWSTSRGRRARASRWSW